MIASEARPGGNVTGIEPYIGGLPAKQIELARELLPGVAKIGLLTNDADPKGASQVAEIKAAAQAMGLRIVSANANRPEDVETALQTLAKEEVDIVIVLQTNMLLGNRSAIAKSALGKRLPTVTVIESMSWMAGSSATALIFAGASGAPPILPSKSCAVRHPATYR